MNNQEIRLVDSYSSKDRPHVSYEIVSYNNQYYGGYNLYKNFINHLCNDKTVEVRKISSPIEMNNILSVM